MSKYFTHKYNLYSKWKMPKSLSTIQNQIAGCERNKNVISNKDIISYNSIEMSCNSQIHEELKNIREPT